MESTEQADWQSLVEDIRDEWRLLWHDRFDDKVRAESVANRDYSLLFVDRGVVIAATRDFRPLNFREILGAHAIQNVERFVSPPPSVGGWRKFARTVLNKQQRYHAWKDAVSRRPSRAKNLQRKKGGRGWLHFRMNR